MIKNDNFLRKIDNNINVSYVSKKGKYAILYMDESRCKAIRNDLERTKGVLDVIDSKIILESF